MSRPFFYFQTASKPTADIPLDTLQAVAVDANISSGMKATDPHGHPVNALTREALPNCVRIISASPHGTSLWTWPLRIDAELADGTAVKYFMKVARKRSLQMLDLGDLHQQR